MRRISQMQFIRNCVFFCIFQEQFGCAKWDRFTNRFKIERCNSWSDRRCSAGSNRSADRLGRIHRRISGKPTEIAYSDGSLSLIFTFISRLSARMRPATVRSTIRWRKNCAKSAAKIWTHSSTHSCSRSNKVQIQTSAKM